MHHRINSYIPGTLQARVPPNSGEYKRLTAVPVMNAIDALPPEYRELVNEFDYIGVYLAWRSRTPPAVIRAQAAEAGGVYHRSA